jgi:hypothetical protein
VWPRQAGSWPGYVFTGEPLKLAAVHFGLGHGKWRSRPQRILRHSVHEPQDPGL